MIRVSSLSRFSLPSWMVMVMLVPGALAGADDNTGEAFFRQRIEPMLQQHCFACHSHAAQTTESGLTLDSRHGWSTGGDRGPAIAPGKPDESLLLRAVRGQIDGLEMPPDDPLSASEIDDLARWISGGAVDPRQPVTSQPKSDPLDWWSLKPLGGQQVPAVHQASGTSRASNLIDAFLDQRLNEMHLQPLDPADRRTLIRRLYFDLHGLPPSPGAVDQFVLDDDPLAYERLVDRLLASPRYGERWARHWLDTVHFADSHGCEHDHFRPHAWRYRDYVINSLNQDKPWSQFVREQLAADFFCPEQSDLLPALGYLAAGPLELSRAGTAPVTFDYLDRDDMVTQVMASFASTTANCARCHNHKFDPVSQEDYYALQAVFAGCGKGDVSFDSDSKIGSQRLHWQGLLTAAENHDGSILLQPEFSSLVSDWEQSLGEWDSIWQPLHPSTFVSTAGATLRRRDDSALLVSGAHPQQDTYTITAELPARQLSAVRLEVLPDASLPASGPGRAGNGNLHLSRVDLLIFPPAGQASQRLTIASAVADWDQQGWTIAHAVDEDPATAWGIHPQEGKPHQAVFDLSENLPVQPGSRLAVVLHQLHPEHSIGCFRLSVSDRDQAGETVIPESLRPVLELDADQRSPGQRIEIAAHVLRLHARRQLAALPPQSLVYAVSNQYSHAKKLAQPMEPKVVHVLSRGNISRPGVEAKPGALSIIDSLPGRFAGEQVLNDRQRRAALADWLAAKENPLTWRSIVNRVWARHFGVGICDTPNDLGRMGGQPTHPELLDWLAVWFRDQAAGSLKQLHRSIVLSAAYRRRSLVHVDHPNQRVDANNRMLWRMNSRRLDAESFRDAVLGIAGRLDDQMGGAGIEHFTQIAGRQGTPELNYADFDWQSSAATRRSIYRVVWRGIADPFMESLDFPDLGLLAPKRSTAGSSLQALALMNNDFVLHHSEVLADKLCQSHSTVGDQVIAACQLIYQRRPSTAEQTEMSDHVQRYGLASLCRVLLNSNEFMLVD